MSDRERNNLKHKCGDELAAKLVNLCQIQVRCLVSLSDPKELGVGLAHHAEHRRKEESCLVWDHSWHVYEKAKTIQSSEACMVQEWLMRREELGSHATLYRELHDKPDDGFIQYIRMDINSFHTHLGRVGPYITKQGTHLRQSISPDMLICTEHFV